MFVENELARKFYMEMCRLEKWPTRTLDEKIDSQLYERTAISRRPEDVIKAELDNIKDTGKIHPDLVLEVATSWTLSDCQMHSVRTT